jgi:hypothetical protein
MKHLVAIAILGGIVFLWPHYLSAQNSAGQTTYTLENGKKFSFEFEITVDMSDEIISYKGMTHYTVTAASEKQIRLTYQGGLLETIKRKESTPFPPFGPPRGFPGLPAFFTQLNFLGKTQTTNQITMLPRGQVLALDGSSQLPYLLGNLSLMPFELLPTEDQQQWSTDSGVSITDSQSDVRFPHRPFLPAGLQNRESTQVASESTQYEITSVEAEQITLSKEYKLVTPDTGDRESFQMTGSGSWVFNAQEHVPQSSHVQYRLLIKYGNTTTTIPIEVKFQRVTAERLAQIAADNKAAQERLAKRAAEQKAADEATLSADELRELVANLNSKDQFKVTSALHQLIRKTPQAPEAEIAAAIRQHLAGSIAGTPFLADRALRNYDPTYKCNKEYEGPQPVESSNLPVASMADLWIGQIVQVREHGSQWWPAEIAELLADGQAIIRYRGWGNHRTATLSVNHIQLAPQAVEQVQPPAKKVTPSPAKITQDTAEPTSRTWADVSGSFKVEAVYLGVSNELVTLRRADGREISVPLARLSLDDRKYIAELQAAAQLLGNPFEPANP